VLAGLGSAAALASGCVSPLGAVGSGGSAGRETVSVLAAGSLQHALSEGFGDVDHDVQVETRGSVAVARLVATGKRDPDVVALADVDLFDSILDAPWYATVATNALVVAYDENSDGGSRVGAADRWFDPVLSGEATLGRTDPDLDPLGYRTLFMLSLAAAYYDRPDLRRRLLDERQVYPETSLLSRLETGDLDAAVVYRTMAAERDFAFRELPPAVDLSDPDRAEAYADASYTLADGERVTGDVIRYGARARNDREATRAVFERIAGGDLLADQGFTVGERFPTYRGELPRVYRP
jgi:molybdate/tungstate transport system substrate-binding protein